MSRIFDIGARIEPQADGSHTLTITATGLTLDQANQISEGGIVVGALTDGGRLPHEVIASDGGETRQ